MMKRAYNTDSEAMSAANSQMSELNRQGCTGSLTMSKGDASIRGGQRISIRGTRPGIDGDYLVETASHTLSKDGGLSTSLQFYSEVGTEAPMNATDNSTSE